MRPTNIKVVGTTYSVEYCEDARDVGPDKTVEAHGWILAKTASMWF